MIMKNFLKISLVISVVAIVGYFIYGAISLYLFAGGCKGNKSTVFMFNCSRGELGYSFEKFLQKNPNYKFGPGFDSARCFPLDYCTDIHLKGEKDFALHLGLVSANMNDSATTAPSYISIRSVYNILQKEWSDDYNLTDSEMAYLDEKLKSEVLSKLKNDSCNCALIGKENR